MSTWNYRIIKHEEKSPKQKFFAIHEVYYDERGKIKGWTEEAIPAMGETLVELKQDYKMMAEAFECPIIRRTKKNKR